MAKNTITSGILSSIFGQIFRRNNKLTTLYPKKGIKIKGRILYSYLNKHLLLKQDDPVLEEHSNKWESREIAHLFANGGYIVDAVDWQNSRFVPKKHYDIVFDIYTNLQRWAPYLSPGTLKIMHLTGSYPEFQNDAELARIKEYKLRTHGEYKPKRLLTDAKLSIKSMKLADVCTLIGNNYTFLTYPDKIRKKITCITVTASKIEKIKNPEKYIPKEKEFLWFFGNGAVHKGLDLVLEAFADKPEYTLNIVGNIDSEKDFIRTYRKEIYNTKNIKYHGWLNPSSKEFFNIVKKCFCFIAPSCSEGISPAVATCMQLGLYPIVSKETGITLPKNAGKYLTHCSLPEIIKAIKTTYKKTNPVLKKEIYLCQKKGLILYSHRQFTDDFNKFIKNNGISN